MKKTVLFQVFTFLGITALWAQNPSATITTWKNDAKGAYNIIHDDFGDWSTQGIQNYADTMHYNRGLKFTFGAITSSCEGNSGVYGIAKNMILNHGHEIINHSHTHSCAIGSASCGGEGVNFEWAVPGPSNAFDMEIDKSHTSIKTNTGYTPRFYIYPYDQFNDTANSYLQKQGYIGSRTGAYNAAENAEVIPDDKGFFRPAFVVDVADELTGTHAINLDMWIDEAIANKQWVCRELHNIGNTGWGSVTEGDYRAHLNYVKSKVDAGDLWVGTISEILTYQIQKINYANPNTAYSAVNKEINIAWPSPSFDVANYLLPLQVKSPVTIKVNLDGIVATDYLITQGGNSISNKTIKNGLLYFEAYPHEGNIKITLLQCPTVCIIAQPSNKTVTQGNANVTLEVIASSDQPITYQWMKNGKDILGANAPILTFAVVQLADAGLFTVKIMAGQTTELSTEVTLTVNKKQGPESTPYHASALLIPGKIEAEEFDNGGQNVAYYDFSNSNEGDATNFRPGASVDIEQCIDGDIGYNIGYAQAGEWLLYTVDVLQTQAYDLEIRYATLNATPIIKLSLDDAPITSNISLANTGGWTKYESVMVSNIPLTEGLNQKLKIEMVSSAPNLNYLVFTPAIPNGIHQTIQPLRMSVSPNPTLGAFVVNGIEEGVVQIFTLEGVLIREYTTQTQQTSLSIADDFKAGLYVIKYLGKNIVQSTRLVKL